MREEAGGTSPGSSETDSIEEQPSLRFRIEYQSGDLICFVGQVSDLYGAWTKMAAYDPEGIFNLRVVDNETEEIIPDIMMAMAGLHVNNKRKWVKEDPNINWAKEGF